MRIVPVACLKDNYAYLVICEQTRTAVVVDPSQASPVLSAAEEAGVELQAVWNTHHHWDHTGGNKELLDAHPELSVLAHESDRGRIPGQTAFLSEGDSLEVGEEVRATIIHNPGHTSGAVSFYLADAGVLFTGDTLFAAGCGRLFEGTPADMHTSLTTLSDLPDATQVYCGHEYTVANLKFAATVEPDNADIAGRQARVDKLRSANTPSVPFRLDEDRATNPFLRVTEAAVIAAANANEPPKNESPVEIFAAIRRWKDRF